jgi:hypothetical protein
MLSIQLYSYKIEGWILLVIVASETGCGNQLAAFSNEHVNAHAKVVCIKSDGRSTTVFGGLPS